MVVVSHQHQFIFLKTRKTAGSSIETSLQPFCAPPGIDVPHDYFTISDVGIIGAMKGPKKRLRRETPAHLPIWYHHMPAAEVALHLGQAKFDAYQKISAVRNPFDRMVSYFHFHKRNEHDGTEDFSVLRRQFHEFVKTKGWNDDVEVVTLDQSYVVDHMIRFEHLHNDLEKVFRALGLPFDPAGLAHEKSMSKTRKQYAIADYFDAECIDITRRRMKWVFDRFDYPDSPGPLPDMASAQSAKRSLV